MAWVREGRIELRFPYDEEDIRAVKAIAGRRWLKDRRQWVIPDSPETRGELLAAFGPRLVLTVLPGASELRAPSTPSTATDDPRRATADPVASRDRTRANHGSRSSPAAPSHPGAEGLLEALSVAIRAREYSPRTERAYRDWVRRFLDFHQSTPPADAALDPARGRRFLEHLAVDARLAAKTRNQAASALAFLFRELLSEEGFAVVPRAREPRTLPTVLSHREVLSVLKELRGRHRLIVSLLYSAGLRLQECLRIRVRDVDLELRQIFVRNGKGKKDRYVPLAERAAAPLRKRIERRRELHERDLAHGRGWTPLPGALDKKEPRAGYELAWQFVFASRAIHTDSATGRRGRRALHPSAVQREVKRAARAAGIQKRVTCHTFRHSFATETLRGGCDIRTLQHVLGHEDVRTTMIYLHVVEQTGLYIRSPLDRPADPEDADLGAGKPKTPSD